MRAMVLAAGRGERMRPLTDTVPKPLLPVGGKPLIVWQVERLVAGGFDEIVVNLAWLGDLIETELGDGSRFGARISYSHEGEALETLGGIVFALPLIAGNSPQPFAVVSADIYTEYDYASLRPHVATISGAYPHRVGHFVLTDNPAYHPAGDMGLVAGRIVREPAAAGKLTYANIAVFHPQLFSTLARGIKRPLFPWAYGLLEGKGITGEHYRGFWENIGTSEQLSDLDRRLPNFSPRKMRLANPHS